jgi:hypothetical protein
MKSVDLSEEMLQNIDAAVLLTDHTALDISLLKNMPDASSTRGTLFRGTASGVKRFTRHRRSFSRNIGSIAFAITPY